MRRRNTAILLAAFAAGCTDAIPTGTDAGFEFAPAVGGSQIVVTNNNDAGAGSFRDAIVQANADATIGSIRFAQGVGTVQLLSTVTYTGAQNLRIDGFGAVLDGAGVATDAFASTGGGDLELRGITVRNAPEDGVWVEIPAGATGVVSIRLHEVTIRDNGRFGLHVDDRIGGEPGGSDSDAGISLDISFSHIINNNADLTVGVVDFDGVRVDEGGNGDIDARVTHSVFTDNRADGLELDEADSGNAILFVRQSSFEDNGDQVQVPPDAEPDPEDGFDVDEAGPGDLHLDVAQTVSRRNIDDGIDLDEDGEGTIFARINQVDASGNHNDCLVFTEDEFNQVGAGGVHVIANAVNATGCERGIDSDEWGDGDIRVHVTGSHFDGNASDGIRFEEEGAGSVYFTANSSSLDGNGDEGLQVAELVDGSIYVTFVNSTMDGNADHGAQIEEDDAASAVQDGDIVLDFRNSSVSNNNDDGLQIVERLTGSVLGTFNNCRLNDNLNFGIRAQQQAPGSGAILLLNTQVMNNGDGMFNLSNVVIS